MGDTESLNVCTLQHQTKKKKKKGKHLFGHIFHFYIHNFSFWQQTKNNSPKIYHVSPVMCHISRVTNYLSPVTNGNNHRTSPANSPTIQSWLDHQDRTQAKSPNFFLNQQCLKTFFFKGLLSFEILAIPSLTISLQLSWFWAPTEGTTSPHIHIYCHLNRIGLGLRVTFESDQTKNSFN